MPTITADTLTLRQLDIVDEGAVQARDAYLSRMCDIARMEHVNDRAYALPGGTWVTIPQARDHIALVADALPACRWPQ